MKRFFRLVFGTTLLVLGALGLFLPILQGILFIIAGLLILAPESRSIRKLLDFFKRKYPFIFSQAEKVKRKFSNPRAGSGTEAPDAAISSRARRLAGKNISRRKRPPGSSTIRRTPNA